MTCPSTLPCREKFGSKPWSLAGLVATLKVPMQEISTRHPQMTARSFVDDRSWSTRFSGRNSGSQCEWHSWSGKLGLQESKSKTQFFVGDQSCEKALLRNGAKEQQVSCSPCLLGSVFKGTARRTNTPKEEERLCTSLNKLRTKMQFRQFGVTVRRALNEPKRACVHLRNILRGHRTNLLFRILELNVLAARRCALKFPDAKPCTWQDKQGWATTLKFVGNFLLEAHADRIPFSLLTVVRETSQQIRAFLLTSCVKRGRVQSGMLGTPQAEMMPLLVPINVTVNVDARLRDKRLKETTQLLVFFLAVLLVCWSCSIYER